MRKLRVVKTNIIGGNVDDVVDTYKQLKDKLTWLDGCIYENNMLVFVKDKQSIYKVKEVLK